jgi:Dihaem cytochrome c
MRFTLLAVALGLAGCVSLPEPTPADVTWAQRSYPETTLTSLTAARRTYVTTCSGCHALHLPKEFPAQRWPSLVDEMVQVQKVKLSPAQRQQIEEYLIVMAEVPEQKNPGH